MPAAFVCLLALALVPSQAVPAATTPEEELMTSDRAFAAAAARSGIDGWMAFMAEDAARMPEFGGEMITGLDAIRAADAALLESGEVQLVWEPAHAHAFADGTHGITTGTYRVVARQDGAVRGAGRYLTLWRLEAGGWKVIFDTGVAAQH